MDGEDKAKESRLLRKPGNTRKPVLQESLRERTSPTETVIQPILYYVRIMVDFYLLVDSLRG